MLTCRNVFSRSLVSSAPRTCPRKRCGRPVRRRRPAPRRALAVVRPATTLGVRTKSSRGWPDRGAPASSRLEVDTGLQGAVLLEDRHEDLLRRPGIGRRLQDHGAAFPDSRSDDGCRARDVRQIGHAVAHRGGHGDHGDVERVDRRRVTDRSVPPRREGRRDLLVGDVLGGGLPVAETSDLVLVDVAADDTMADLHGAQGEGQTDVPLTDEQDVANPRHPLPLPGQPVARHFDIGASPDLRRLRRT